MSMVLKKLCNYFSYAIVGLKQIVLFFIQILLLLQYKYVFSVEYSAKNMRLFCWIGS